MPCTTRRSSAQLADHNLEPAKRARPGRPPALSNEDHAFVLFKLHVWQLLDPLWIYASGRNKAQALVEALQKQRGVSLEYRSVFNKYCGASCPPIVGVIVLDRPRLQRLSSCVDALRGVKLSFDFRLSTACWRRAVSAVLCDTESEQAVGRYAEAARTPHKALRSRIKGINVVARKCAASPASLAMPVASSFSCTPAVLTYNALTCNLAALLMSVIVDADVSQTRRQCKQCSSGFPSWFAQTAFLRASVLPAA